jgi:cytochrome c
MGNTTGASRTPTLRAVAALAVALAATGIAVGSARAGDVAYGEYLAGECVTCHRVDGAEKGIPAIVGWEAAHFVAVLDSYKRKERPNEVMQTIAGRLSEADMAALAAYFGSLQAPAHNPVANAR